MLTARILPPAEWPRLVGTESEKFATVAPTRPVLPFVVEEDGRVVGTWTLTSYQVLEGLGVAAERRGKVAVQRALLREVRRFAAQTGLHQVVTFSASAEVDRMLDRIGARAMPAAAWILPLTQEGACQL